ncbi:MAG: chorismate mutase [Lachnospiraceae bacterium]|nr:chorismate mutase [Lachnospiraceae bacterium]
MDLKDLRVQIDGIDDQLVELFKKRLDIATEVARAKEAQGLPILNSAREREIVNRLTQELDDEMAGYVKILYTTLFDLSRAHQAECMKKHSVIGEKIEKALKETPELFPKSATVACQGIEGANSTIACEKMFARPSILYFNNFEGVIAAVEKGLCQYGILPIENSLHGSVIENYDLMNKHHFYIVNSIKIKINHFLLAKPGTKKEDIKVVYSHEQAIGQCSELLKSMNVEVIPCENTAIAAKKVAESNDPGVAAISSRQCAELYNLSIVEENLQNNENNYTKFVCISKKLEIYPGAKKISLMLTLPHKPGALYELMAKFTALGINLTKLESRPIPNRDFEFMFYFDLDVSVYDKAVFNLFSQLENGMESFEFMGCYNEN